MLNEDAAARLRGPRSQGCRAVEGGRRRRGREEAERGRIGGFRMQRWGVAAPRGFARRRSKILAAALLRARRGEREDLGILAAAPEA